MTDVQKLKARACEAIDKRAADIESFVREIGKNAEVGFFETRTAGKVAEFLIGRDLEKKYNKDEILELYVNTIYFGDGYYGIQEASKGYFNKDAKDLTLYEATMLAGVPNAPSLYAPTINFHLTQSRQKKVVSSMVETGTLSQEEADKLYTQIDSSTYSK